MLKIYDVKSAKYGILKREPLEDLAVSEKIQTKILQLFGEPINPAQAVERIIRDVRKGGDTSLKIWTDRLDGGAPSSLLVPKQELLEALSSLPVDLKAALELSIERVKKFHEAQPVTSWMTQSLGGTVGQFIRPIHRIGVYVPGGTAPLPSSVIMAVVPAMVAGVSQIAVVSPPVFGTGKIAPVILATAALLGVEEMYAAGGAQAIAALTFGTESIRRVDKIFGPGNLFVTLAKRQVYGMVGIDGLAGPTETVVIADDTAQPAWVAADLLAQAEHDTLAAAILITPSRRLIEKVNEEISRQLQERSRRQVINVSLESRSGAVYTRDLDEAVDLANEYAPEHLCLAVQDPWRMAEKINNAGGVFIGEHSFEVLGDYIAGPSHVMPTGGSARFSSPLNVMDFVHIISLVALDPMTTRNIAGPAALIAHAEGLDAHAAAAEARL